MTLRDQPYLPLFVQDFLTDEKLANCSAASTGVYIRLMCLMHKSHDYGKILLRQKERQSERLISDFAEKLARQMPYKAEVIESALDELIDEDVIYIEDNALCQKRMIKDAILSEKRALSGKKGAEKTNSKNKNKPIFDGSFAAANLSANTEIENEYEIESEVKKKKNVEITNPFSGELHNAFDEWLKYKSEKGQSYKPQGLKSLTTQVRRYAEQFGDQETANAIRDSMANNYQGIIFDRIGKGKGETGSASSRNTTKANRDNERKWNVQSVRLSEE